MREGRGKRFFEFSARRVPVTIPAQAKHYWGRMRKSSMNGRRQREVQLNGEQHRRTSGISAAFFFFLFFSFFFFLRWNKMQAAPIRPMFFSGKHEEEEEEEGKGLSSLWQRRILG